MPIYNAQAHERIDRVVHAVEDSIDDGTTPDTNYLGAQPWVWWVLTEDLDPDTHEATANPLEWYVKRNSGDGEYAQDISFFTVRDTLENSGAREGSIVLCRPIGSENGTVLEIVFCVDGQAKRCSAILTADAGPGESVGVDNVVPLDGGISPLDDPDDTAETLSATMPPAARALDNAVCEIELNVTAGTWKIKDPHEQARMLRGTLSGAMADSDPSKTITSPVSMDGGQVPTGTLTGYNVFSFEGDSGGEVFLVWNEATDHYEIIQCECPA